MGGLDVLSVRLHERLKSGDGTLWTGGSYSCGRRSTEDGWRGVPRRCRGHTRDVTPTRPRPTDPGSVDFCPTPSHDRPPELIVRGH